jgi:iron complex outermembrane recepter protein
MNQQTRSILASIQCMILVMLAFCFANKVCGQMTAGSGQGAASSPSQTINANTGNVDAGNLDKLLDLAEKDVGQLSQVNVAGHTGSPSLDQPVSTVERQESTVGKTPAAVFVITNEMIRRSGAQNIPDALRMVPGVEVAQISSDEWAISARGFNSRYARKLLVQIDGRTVYDLTMAGVFWDVQDLILEDVERIEVIRGPGATIWGSNAVNGVINIITKKAQDTQGLLLQGGAGSMERGYTNARTGGRIGEDLYYRVYGRWFERGETFTPSGAEAGDDWRQARGGFRTDYNASRSDKMTLQGDYYNGYSDNPISVPTLDPPYMQPVGDIHVTGENMLYRWKHTIDEDRDWTIQTYYDRTERHELTTLSDMDRDLLDIDFQHRFPLGSRNDIIWGCGYRYTQDHFRDAFYKSIIPTSRADRYYNYFLQDQITLVEDRWYFIAGSKFEHNPYTNFEYQPTVRLLWTPTNRHSIWGSVSRAVHVPTRASANGEIKLFQSNPFPPPPVFITLFGNPYFKSEELLAWEFGMRVQATERFSWDLATFFNQYDRIEAAVPGGPYPVPPFGPPDYIISPLYGINGQSGETYGAELAANYTVNDQWRLQLSYTYLRMFLRADPGIVQFYLPGDSPVNQVYAQSSWDLGDHWQFDLIGRYVDNLDTFYGPIPSYIAFDTRLAWHKDKKIEVAVVGRNLTRGYYSEFDPNDLVGPQVYSQVTLRY